MELKQRGMFHSSWTLCCHGMSREATTRLHMPPLFPLQLVDTSRLPTPLFPLQLVDTSRLPTPLFPLQLVDTSRLPTPLFPLQLVNTSRLPTPLFLLQLICRYYQSNPHHPYTVTRLLISAFHLYTACRNHHKTAHFIVPARLMLPPDDLLTQQPDHYKMMLPTDCLS